MILLPAQIDVFGDDVITTDAVNIAGGVFITISVEAAEVHPSALVTE